MKHETVTRTIDAEQRDDRGRRARAKINAWVLALLVLTFYLGFIGIGALKGFGG